jgi:hypothetical protein
VIAIDATSLQKIKKAGRRAAEGFDCAAFEVTTQTAYSVGEIISGKVVIHCDFFAVPYDIAGGAVAFVEVIALSSIGAEDAEAINGVSDKS